MCRYCKIIPKYDEDGWGNYWDNEIDIAEKSGWTGLRMGVLRDGKIYIAATGDDRAFYYPKYCPECGRRLIGRAKMEPTEKQIAYAQYLAQRMCQELPEEYTKEAYSEFISKWKPIVKHEDDGMNEPNAWQMAYM